MISAIEHIRRDILNLSQADLARAVGVNQSTVSRWERSVGEPTLSEARSISRLIADKGMDPASFGLPPLAPYPTPAPSEGSTPAGTGLLSADNDSPAMDGGVFAKSGAPETNTQAAE